MTFQRDALPRRRAVKAPSEGGVGAESWRLPMSFTSGRFSLITVILWMAVISGCLWLDSSCILAHIGPSVG